MGARRHQAGRGAHGGSGEDGRHQSHERFGRDACREEAGRDGAKPHECGVSERRDSGEPHDQIEGHREQHRDRHEAGQGTLAVEREPGRRGDGPDQSAAETGRTKTGGSGGETRRGSRAPEQTLGPPYEQHGPGGGHEKRASSGKQPGVGGVGESQRQRPRDGAFPCVRAADRRGQRSVNHEARRGGRIECEDAGAKMVFEGEAQHATCGREAGAKGEDRGDDTGRVDAHGFGRAPIVQRGAELDPEAGAPDAEPKKDADGQGGGENRQRRLKAGRGSRLVRRGRGKGIGAGDRADQGAGGDREPGGEQDPVARGRVVYADDQHAFGGRRQYGHDGEGGQRPNDRRGGWDRGAGSEVQGEYGGVRPDRREDGVRVIREAGQPQGHGHARGAERKNGGGGEAMEKEGGGDRKEMCHRRED